MKFTEGIQDFDDYEGHLEGMFTRPPNWKRRIKERYGLDVDQEREKQRSS